MKRKLIILFLLLFSILSYSQSNDFNKMNKWIDDKNIEFNNPVTPEGYERFTDCDNRIVYKKISGDTIRFYKWRWTIAENLETFKESMISDNFNVFRYPSETQKNGTIIMVHLGLKEFIFRNDTLYLLDNHNKKLADKKLEATDLMMQGKISNEEYEDRIQNLNSEKSDFKPKFKVIYFKGIFDNKKSLNIPKDLNFRNERVELKTTWTQDNLKCYEIKLFTNDSGEYIFNEEMKFIGLENCNIKRKKAANNVYKK